MVWPPTKRQAWGAIGMVIFLVILLFVGVWLWGVLSSYIQPKTPTDKKDLVNIFVVIAAGVVGTLTVITAVGNLIISRRALQNAHATLQQQRDLEDQRAQEDALQAYFERMGGLMTAYNLKLTDRNDIKLLARAQTLTVAGRLDQRRKRPLLVFLSGAGLINKDATAVDISGADFRDADLNGVRLNGTNLSSINLDNAVLTSAKLDEANLTGAHLTGADLDHANLSYSSLRVAHLRGANLRGANLKGAQLHDDYYFSGGSGGANLKGADLTSAYLNDANLSYSSLTDAKLEKAHLDDADLTGASLTGASLRGASLNGAKLRGAKLIVDYPGVRGADLERADLTDAKLRHADLTDAKVTKEQLVACKSLHGATMPDKQILSGRNNPDGPTFEEWLKSEGCEGDGKDDSSS